MTSTAAKAPARAWIGLMAAVSGAAALVYQTLWMRGFSLAFGSTTTAAAVTLAAFMGGLALGGAWVRRWKRPGAFKEYAQLEAGIALAAALSLVLLRFLPGAFGALLIHRALSPFVELPLRAALAAACVLPAAVLIGATLPVLVQCASSPVLRLTPNFSWLYRLNTLGAVAGVLLASFVLIPRLGLDAAGCLAVAGNLCVAALARKFSREAAAPVAAVAAAPSLRLGWRMAGLALALGLSTFVLEVAWMRSMALSVGSSVYAFELMLAALLLGTALGTRAYEAWAGRVGDPLALLGKLLPLLAACVLLQAWLCGKLPGAYYQVIRHSTLGFAGHQAAIFLLAFAVMLPVTALQGFLFPLLLRLDLRMEEQPQAAAGGLYAWNTVGAIAGALSAAFLLIPRWGVQAAFSWAAAPVLLLWAVTLPAPVWKRGTALSLALAISGLCIHSYRPWNKLSVSSGPFLYALAQRERSQREPDFDRWAAQDTELIYYQEGRETLVSVNRSGTTTSLKVNGKVDASNGDLEAFKLVAHIPLVLHPDAKRIMLIGWGSGCSAGAAGLYPLQSIDCAEIEPAVFDARRFFSFMNRDIDRDPRFHIFFEDGRNFLLKSPGAYDVIFSQPSNPWMKGVASLFTQDFYRLASAKLAPGGLFSQWFHFYQMSEADLKMVVRTFGAVFPYSSLWIVPFAGKQAVITGDLILVGSLSPHQLDPQRLKALWKDARLAADFASLGVDSPRSLALNLMLEGPALQAWAGPGALNLDSRPRLEYSAPRAIYLSREAISQQNLVSFYGLEQVSSLPPSLGAFPGSHPGADEAQDLRDTAELCMIKNRAMQAEVLLRTAQSRWPRDARFDWAWAQVFLAKGDSAQGEARLKSFLKVEPGHRDAWGRLGKLYMAEHRFDEAVPYFQAMARKFPQAAEPLVGQGIALVQLQRYSEAITPLKRAVQLDPQDPLAGGLLKKLEDQAGR